MLQRKEIVPVSIILKIMESDSSLLYTVHNKAVQV
jgi:hypothetical protein